MADFPKNGRKLFEENKRYDEQYEETLPSDEPTTGGDAVEQPKPSHLRHLFSVIHDHSHVDVGRMTGGQEQNS